jgi:ribosomal 50S subunit-associated protein YjgA (DUF615 family)
MKDPVEAGAVPYRETVFPALDLQSARNLRFTSGYRNPWLAHAMVHTPFRLKSPSALAEVAARVVDDTPAGTADCGAALTVLVYQALANPSRDPRDVTRLLAAIRRQLAVAPSAPHEHRWKISLSFAAAQLLLASGHRDKARVQFGACARLDFRDFSPHIATKTTEAAFMAGKLAFLDGDNTAARRAWQRGIAIGRDLLGVPLEEILIAPDQPHVFGIGDGMREFTLAWDNVTRCANGMHVLAELRKLGQSRLGDLENSWQRAEATNQHFVDTITEQGTLIRRLQSMHSESEGHFATERVAAAHAARDAQGHIDALKAQLDELAGTSRQQASHIASLEKERDRLVAEVATANKETSRASKGGQKHIDELKVQLDKVAAASRDQVAYIELLTKERDRLASSEKSLNETLTNARAEAQAHIRRLTKQLEQHSAESQGHIDGLRAQLEKSGKEHAALVDHLKSNLDKVAAACREQAGYIEVLTKERDRLASSEKSLNEAITKTRIEGEAHVRKLTKQLEQHTAESQGHIDGLRAQLELSGNEHAALIDHLKSDLEKVAAACRAQAGYIGVLTKERDRLAALEQEMRAKESDYLKVIAEQTAYLKQLESMRDKHDG